MKKVLLTSFLVLLALVGVASAFDNNRDSNGAPSSPLANLLSPLSPSQGGTGLTALFDDLFFEKTRPLVIVLTGQSDAINVGENGDVGTLDSNGYGQIDQSGGGIKIYNDATGTMDPAQYGVYPLNSHPPGLTTWSPNIGIEAARAARRSAVQPSRPIWVFKVAMGGMPISNWSLSKVGLTGTRNDPTAITLLAAQLLAMGVTKVDFLMFYQGETDGLSAPGAIADTYSGNNYPPWGFGSGTANLVTGPYTSQSTIDGVVAAGGTNTKNGFWACLQQTIVNLRTLPGVSGTTPLLFGELSTDWRLQSYARNDGIWRLNSGDFPYVGIVPSTGMQSSQLAGNGNHMIGPWVNKFGARFWETFLLVHGTSRGKTPTDTNGNATSPGTRLKLVSNVDDSGGSKSLDGTYYAIPADMLRAPLYVYTTGSAINLPRGADVPGNPSVIVENWSTTPGPTTIFCQQAMAGFPGPVTMVAYAMPFGTISMFSYTLPLGRFLVTGGSGRWSLTPLSNNLGLLQPNTYGGNANIGTNAATAVFSAALVTGNAATLSYTVGGVTSTVSATFDGTTNTSPDNTTLALATALQAALGSTYTVDAIAGANAVTVFGPAQVTFNAGASSVVGGASQASVAAALGVYAIPVRMLGQAWGAAGNITYIMPPANGSTPGDIALISNGGGGTAGQIFIDLWGDLGYFAGATSPLPGAWGVNPVLRIDANQSIDLAPDSASRWRVKSQSAVPAGLRQGGTLFTNAFRLNLTASPVAGNSLQFTGTVTPSGGSATSIGMLTQPFVKSANVTLGFVAKGLQTLVTAALPGAIVTPVYGQNVIQIDLPAGATMALTGTVTGGASQATVSQDSGSYSLSVIQAGFDYYIPSGATVVHPSPNGFLSQRFGFNALAANAAGATIAGLSAGSVFNRTGQTVSNFILRPGMTAVTEATEAGRISITGGSYYNWSELQLIASPTTGSTATLTPGVEKLAVRITGSSIAALTLALPTAPLQGDRIVVESETAVTTLTFSGGTTFNAPGALTATTFFTLEYQTSGARWARVG